jgi:hypothetical protein
MALRLSYSPQSMPTDEGRSFLRQYVRKEFRARAASIRNAEDAQQTLQLAHTTLLSIVEESQKQKR